MTLAIVAAAFSLPLTAGVWRWFSLRKMELAILADVEKRKEAHIAESKRWQDAVDASAARMGALEATLGASLAEIQTRLARVEQGREPIRRAG